MSQPVPQGDPPDPLVASVRRRQERQERQAREGDRPLLAQVSWIGALGWLIVTPTLLGVLAGRALDRWAGTGILWTGALLVLGVALGAWLAWQRMNANGKDAR